MIKNREIKFRGKKISDGKLIYGWGCFTDERWGFMESTTADSKRLQRELEVIGNIHENPELLKSTQSNGLDGI